MTASAAALVWCPFPDEECAATVAATLLDEGAVVCANLLPPMRSLYVWRGERGEAQEVGALFKTTAPLLDRAVARIADLHPYETPAIVGWHCEAAAAQTLVWLADLGGGRG